MIYAPVVAWLIRRRSRHFRNVNTLIMSRDRDEPGAAVIHFETYAPTDDVSPSDHVTTYASRRYAVITGPPSLSAATPSGDDVEPMPTTCLVDLERQTIEVCRQTNLMTKSLRLEQGQFWQVIKTALSSCISMGTRNLVSWAYTRWHSCYSHNKHKMWEAVVLLIRMKKIYTDFYHKL